VVRVVSGEFGGRKLVAPAGTATRPTTDKVREAVFNSLVAQGIVAGAVVVDLFAGSGALGIEALSRGAVRCIFVERDRAALRALRENVAVLRLDDRATIVTSDVMAWVPAMRGVDLALIDPPYTFEAWDKLLSLLQVEFAVCEAPNEVPAFSGWSTLRSKRYGRTWTTLLARNAVADVD
jgi:16S rRNA (guanine966-N2)-methyltransferase